MPCFGPQYAYFSREVNPSGRRAIVFDKRQSFSGIPILIPCGECIGCRLKWRREWAIRCMHEKRMHGESAFVTLTYADESLPPLSTLSIRDLQLFMKRLRKQRESGLRFFACGEYGDTTQRPHYHILLFNTSFRDMRYLKDSPSGERLFRSVELTDLWGKGECYVGTVTPKSAAYVCGYVLKKVGTDVDYSPREPEFRVMSRRPGIGLSWLQRFQAEAYDHDSAIMDSHEVSLPRYYDAKFVEIGRNLLFRPGIAHFGVDNDRLAYLKRKRRSDSLALNPQDRTKERLLVREKFELLKQERFKREV